jgi:hypothetical protein
MSRKTVSEKETVGFEEWTDRCDLRRDVLNVGFCRGKRSRGPQKDEMSHGRNWHGFE